MNRNSRKPFFWGGLKGYQQLEAIAQALHRLQVRDPESAYLHSLLQPVEYVLQKNRNVAEDLQAAHQKLCQIAHCLHYPPLPVPQHTQPDPGDEKLSSHGVAREMEKLIDQFQPTGKLQQAQHGLFSALKKRWKRYAQELLYCYDIPGLPQDNLQLESFFGRLRCHQRRISGRKSTQALHDFGQAQALFRAESQTDLLLQIQQVPIYDYLVHRQRLAQVELPRQFFRRLHHDPLTTISRLIAPFTNHRNVLTDQNILMPIN